jgi:hypothetical protein
MEAIVVVWPQEYPPLPSVHAVEVPILMECNESPSASSIPCKVKDRWWTQRCHRLAYVMCVEARITVGTSKELPDGADLHCKPNKRDVRGVD